MAQTTRDRHATRYTEDLELTLLAFSEWLDAEGLILDQSHGDDRSHEELAQAFLDTTL